jgi:hypothetical protein
MGKANKARWTPDAIVFQKRVMITGHQQGEALHDVKRHVARAVVAAKQKKVRKQTR